ncbi:MAG: nitrous oxide-stimulated promoter family protein [Blautia sp.]|nr:nitrous oxide-stimulated promoter family protein [Blautia sp.]
MTDLKRKREREKQIVSTMIAIYCRGKHGKKKTLCSECKESRGQVH